MFWCALALFCLICTAVVFGGCMAAGATYLAIQPATTPRERRVCLCVAVLASLVLWAGVTYGVPLVFDLASL